MAWSEAVSNVQTIGNTGKRIHISVCIPHFGNVSLEWADVMYAPLKFIAQPDFDKSVKIARGILNLDTERNVLAKFALEEKAMTHILFLDTDVVAESPPNVHDAIRMLLACDAPIASGLYRAKKKEGFPYAFWGKALKPDGSIALLNVEKWSGNWLEVDFTGFGFILIKREVFEKTPEPWFVWDKPEPSEDFSACLKFKEHGFPTRILTDVKLSHLGQLKVKSDGKVECLAV